MRLIICLFLVLLISSCSSDGFFYSEINQIKYQIIELSVEEEPLLEGDNVDFSLQIYTQSNVPIMAEDSIYTIQLSKSISCICSLSEVFLELNKGDSLVMFVNSNDFFACQNWIMPHELTGNEIIPVHIKIHNSASELALINAKKVKKQWQDLIALQTDSLVNQWKTISDTVIKYENMYIALLDTCMGLKVEKGNKVKMIHKSMRLNGSLIEESTLKEPFELIAGEQDQVIDGIRIAMGYMCFGQRAKILIPFKYSFSESFRNQVGIYKDPIICEIELLN